MMRDYQVIEDHELSCSAMTAARTGCVDGGALRGAGCWLPATMVITEAVGLRGRQCSTG
jgi:hypothetical protein